MPSINPDDFIEFGAQDQRRVPRFKKQHRNPHAFLQENAAVRGLSNLGADVAFTPSLGASRHEREWILTWLAGFYENNQITDVFRRIKGGKEANVYVCRADPQTGHALLAAKLFRPRMFRSLRNDAQYRQNRAVVDERGKAVTDRRALKALARGSSYGQKLRQISWHQTEYLVLEKLHRAGLPVPEPIASNEKVILMQYLGNELFAAPSLMETHLPENKARPVFHALVESLAAMLKIGVIHADLSPFNILFWEEKPWLIDFPQAIDPAQNPDAEFIFHRDVQRVCAYFRGYAWTPNAAALADSLWREAQSSYAGFQSQSLSEQAQ